MSLAMYTVLNRLCLQYEFVKLCIHGGKDTGSCLGTLLIPPCRPMFRVAGGPKTMCLGFGELGIGFWCIGYWVWV